jgi:hypothetical protein
MANKAMVANKPKVFKPTQIEVDEDRWRRMKSAAALQGKTIKQLVDELFADFLGEPID